MKLAFIFCIYKRHELEKIVINRLIRQSNKFGFEIIIAGSEGRVSKRLAKGCHYIEIDNFPVSNKHNSLLVKAKQLNVDGVVLLGSDDMVSDSYIEFIYKQSKDEFNIIGLRDIFFYETRGKKSGHWLGYGSSNQSVGAGRFFSKRILEACNWTLWSEGLNSGLDNDCAKRLSSKGIEDISFYMDKINAYCVDIKYTQSITSRSIIDVCEPINTDVLSAIFKDDFDLVSKLENKALEFDLSLYNGVVEFVGTGKFKSIRKGDVLSLDYNTALPLLQKGFIK